MKKLLATGTAIIALAICSVANAAGIGDSIEPLGKEKGSISLINNTVLDRDYEPTGTFTKVNLDEMKETYAKITVGVSDDLNLYGILGKINFAELTADWTEASVDYITKFKMDSDFLWGMGINNVYKVEDESFIDFIGTDLHWMGWETDIDEIDLNGTSATNIKGTCEYSEIQGAMYIGKHFDFSSEISYKPYMGALYNYSKIKISPAPTYTAGGSNYTHVVSIDNADKFGVALGTNVEINKSFVFNIEGRFITETAMTISGTFKF